MKYRTQEQFEEIMESIENGNWTQGARECVKYGFYAHDLVNSLDEYLCGRVDTETLANLVYLIEMATEIRGENK